MALNPSALLDSLLGRANARRATKRATRALAFDSLEARLTPTVFINPNAYNFEISITGGETVVVSQTADHNVRVTVNGKNRDQTVAAADVVKMNITANGSGANLIDLSKMTADYNSLISINVWGGGGNDTIKGCTVPSVSEYIRGEAGNDTIYGNAGNDKLYGDDGVDTIKGGSGNDTIYGGKGSDNLFGESGKDELRGGDGNDSLDGGTGNDSLYGDKGNDTLYGQDGNDVIYGYSGTDKLRGGNGDDILYGENDNDTLYGDAGKDKLYGGYGSDSLHKDKYDTVVRQ